MTGSTVGTLLQSGASDWAAAPFAAAGAMAAALLGVALLVQAFASFRLRRRAGSEAEGGQAALSLIAGAGNLVLTYLFVMVYQRLHDGNVPLFYQPPSFLCPRGIPCDPDTHQLFAMQQLVARLWGLMVLATLWFTMSGLVLLAGRGLTRISPYGRDQGVHMPRRKTPGGT
jgi:hypothetical protein